MFSRGVDIFQEFSGFFLGGGGDLRFFQGS